MRQADYARGSGEKRLRKWRLFFLLSMTSDFPGTARVAALRRRQRCFEPIQKLRLPSMHISNTSYNHNSWDNKRFLRDFRFRLEEIHHIAQEIGWNRSRSDRNKYRCDSMTATCIILRRRDQATMDQFSEVLRCQILEGAIHGDFIVVRSFARSAQQNRDREA
jgi:hypothetical protein